jgi:hypothetical protein
MPDGQKVVAVPGVGNIAFPGTMDDSAINQAISQHLAAMQPRAMQAKPGGPILNAKQVAPAGDTSSGNPLREGALGASSAIIPESQMSPSWKQNLSTIGTGLNTQVNQAATTPWGQGGPLYGVLAMLGKALMGGAHGVASGVEEMGSSFGKPTTERGIVDSSKFSHGLGATVGNAATLGLLKKSPEVLSDPLGTAAFQKTAQEIINEGPSKARVLADQHAHALELQKHIAGVEDAVHTDAQQAMSQVAAKVDAANPNGAFDKADVGTRLKSAIGDTLSDTSQLPKSVRDLLPKEAAGKQPGPNIGGKALDLSKPDDMAAYQKYKASGAFTSEEIASYEGKATGSMTFEDLKQARSNLGKQMQSLEGAPKAAASAAYGEMSKMLREGAKAAGAEPDWIDANAKWKGYLDDFHRSPVQKTLFGENAHDIMDPLTGKSRVQTLDILSKYEPFGIDMDKINQEVRRSGAIDTVQRLSRPSKMDLIIAKLSPTGAALRSGVPRALRSPAAADFLGGKGFEPENISPKKVYPNKAAAAAALKGKGPTGGNPTPFDTSKSMMRNEVLKESIANAEKKLQSAKGDERGIIQRQIADFKDMLGETH